MSESPRVVIVGGGITGLVTAYTLQQQRPADAQKEVQITLLEAGERLGGKVQTIHFAGIPVDAGAEAVLLQGEVCQLFRELNLESECILPRATRTNIWTRGRLRPLPDGLVMGVPTDLFAIMRSGIVSLPGILRAGMDIFLPRTRLAADPTVQEVIGSRLGNEVLARMVEPLLGGIHAGRADGLSLAAVAPHILGTAREHRSLLLGLWSQALKTRQGAAKKASPLRLSSFADGLNYLVQRLRASLAGVDIRLGSRLQALERQTDGTYRLVCSEGEELVAESVVLAVPAWEASKLLHSLEAASARELGAIEHASVAVAHLGYRRSAFAHQEWHGSGFLVPRADGHLMNACTWVTHKWPRQRETDLIVLRCSAGRAGDERIARMSDSELLEAIQRELVAALNVQERPLETLVTRWGRSFPQYHAGHQARVKRVEAMLIEHLPGVVLAGAAYHGVGLASCVKDGVQTAGRVQAYLASHTAPVSFVAAREEG